MKESGEKRLKCGAYESTLSTADAVPLPQGGRLRGAALCADFCKRGDALRLEDRSQVSDVS